MAIHRLAVTPIHARSAMSFLEFVGCLAALSGGIVLGSIYMGVDMRTMVLGVLEHAEVIEPGVLNQGGDGGSSATTDAESGAARQTLQNLAALISSSSEQQTQPADDSTIESETGEEATPAPSAVDDATIASATRDYWDALTACMLSEAQGRSKGIGNPADWQLFDYLSQRKRGHEAALETLSNLETANVDQRVVQHGEQIVAWHKAGVWLYDRALRLLTDGPTADLTGPFAQSWQSSATQHRMEERVVLERHLAVAGYLDRAYDGLAPFSPAFNQQSR